MPPEPIKELQNSLLIADPSLKDGVFDRSVIHLSDYSESEGAIGYILNKPTDKKVGEVLVDPLFSGLKNIPIYFGGPVGTDHIVFSAYWWDEKIFRYRLRVSAEEALEMKHRPGSMLIAHVGHSSWYSGQLEKELEENAWFPSQVLPDTISLNANHLWKGLLNEMSPYHRLIALTPEDISLN